VVRIVRSAVNAEIEASIGSTVERSLNFCILVIVGAFKLFIH
jgi:hypothetical protein